MKTIRTGPSAFVFTLASDAGRDEILQTARRVFRMYGVRMRGPLMLECYTDGAQAVVFASCRPAAMYRFDSIVSAYDAALGCRSAPADLYRCRGSYYIEAAPDIGLGRFSDPVPAAERRAVLGEGRFVAGNFIERIRDSVK